MSVDRNFYVICGYDITGYDTDKFNDWLWTKDGESFTCDQTVGKIQLFTDPMSGDHLRLGYILAAFEEYDGSKIYRINYLDIDRRFEDVYVKLKYLIEHGIIDEAAYGRDPGILAFIEYR